MKTNKTLSEMRLPSIVRRNPIESKRSLVEMVYATSVISRIEINKSVLFSKSAESLAIVSNSLTGNEVQELANKLFSH